MPGPDLLVDYDELEHISSTLTDDILDVKKQIVVLIMTNRVQLPVMKALIIHALMNIWFVKKF